MRASPFGSDYLRMTTAGTLGRRAGRGGFACVSASSTAAPAMSRLFDRDSLAPPGYSDSDGSGVQLSCVTGKNGNHIHDCKDFKCA